MCLTTYYTKHMTFVKVKDTGKTGVWEIRNTKSSAVLGYIRWWSPWRKYVFTAEAGCVFDAGCLGDIREFLTKAKMDHANNLGRQKEA